MLVFGEESGFIALQTFLGALVGDTEVDQVNDFFTEPVFVHEEPLGAFDALIDFLVQLETVRNLRLHAFSLSLVIDYEVSLLTHIARPVAFELDTIRHCRDTEVAVQQETVSALLTLCLRLVIETIGHQILLLHPETLVLRKVSVCETGDTSLWADVESAARNTRGKLQALSLVLVQEMLLQALNTGVFVWAVNFTILVQKVSQFTRVFKEVEFSQTLFAGDLQLLVRDSYVLAGT